MTPEDKRYLERMAEWMSAASAGVELSQLECGLEAEVRAMCPRARVKATIAEIADQVGYAALAQHELSLGAAPAGRRAASEAARARRAAGEMAAFAGEAPLIRRK